MCLELSDIHIECTVKTKSGSQQGDNFGNQTVEVGVRGMLQIKISVAHDTESLIVKAEGTDSVLEESLGGQYRVVSLYNEIRHLR